MQKEKQKVILNLRTLQFTLWNKPQIQINSVSLQSNISVVFNNSYINKRGIDTRDKNNLNLWMNKKEKKIYIETCEWVYLQMSRGVKHQWIGEKYISRHWLYRKQHKKNRDNNLDITDQW